MAIIIIIIIIKTIIINITITNDMSKISENYERKTKPKNNR